MQCVYGIVLPVLCDLFPSSMVDKCELREKKPTKGVVVECCYCMVIVIDAFSGMPFNQKERNISNKHNRLKIPKWQEADHLAIYKRDRGVDLGSINP